MKSRQTGFTYMELLAVMTILGILSLMIVPAISATLSGQKASLVQADLNGLKSQIRIYNYQQGTFPASLDDLVTEGYLPELPVDPFDPLGGSYRYSPPAGAGQPWTLWSKGPNGVDNSASGDDIVLTSTN